MWLSHEQPIGKVAVKQQTAVGAVAQNPQRGRQHVQHDQRVVFVVLRNRARRLVGQVEEPHRAAQGLSLVSEKVRGNPRARDLQKGKQ